MSNLENIVINRVWPIVNISLIGMVIFLVTAAFTYQVCKFLG